MLTVDDLTLLDGLALDAAFRTHGKLRVLTQQEVREGYTRLTQHGTEACRFQILGKLINGGIVVVEPK